MRRRLLIVLAPWLTLLALCSPLLWRAPRMVLLFPAALSMPFEPSPETLPYWAVAAWLIYVGLGWLAVTAGSRRAFWLWWSCGVVLMICNVGAIIFAIAALAALR